MSTPPEISVVVPAYDEAESIGLLIEKVADVLKGAGRSYEIIVVDDGSHDGTSKEVEKRIPSVAGLKLIALRANSGKSAALAAGFNACSASRSVVTIDADLQDDPEEIPALLSKLDEDYDLVSSWKKRRRDPWTKRLPSRIFNVVTSWATGIRLHDFNSGFKVYRREVIDTIDLHGELHRYIPVLASRLGWRIGEVAVRHHPRRFGKSKFGSSRLINGFLDLLLVMFLSGRHRSPLHVFGRLGVIFLAIGSAILTWMAVLWLVEQRLRVRPMLLFGVILVILGIQFISMGLLAEMIAGLQKPGDTAVRKRLPKEDGS